MKTSEQQGNLVAALLKAQKLFPAIGKTKTVNAGRMIYKYAPLESIMDAVRPHLLASDLVLTQGCDGHAITTRLDHISGEWRESAMPVHEQHANMQAYGIEITYRRRYSVQMMLGIVTEDDTDGLDNKRKKHGPRMDGITEERFGELESMTADMLSLQQEGRQLEAARIYYGLPNNEEKLAMWGLLKSESKLRAFIKSHQEAKP